VATVLLQHYDLNEPWEFTSTFKVNGTNTDPTVVTATIYKPDGTSTILTYPHADLTKDAVGIYRVKGTASIVGPWYVMVAGTGAAAARERHEFVVDTILPDDLLSDSALITMYEAETWLARAGNQTLGEREDDEIIAALVDSASHLVQSHIDRRLRPLEEDATKLLRYDGFGIVSFAPWELRAATSVTLYSDRPTSYQEILLAGDATTDAEYLLNPRGLDSRLLTYGWMNVPRSYRVYGRNPGVGHEVAVLGDWGVTTIPGDIKLAVKEIVRLSYPEILSTGGPSDISTDALSGFNWLPQQLMGALESYRRMVP
jgi:hypothetical protein